MNRGSAGGRPEVYTPVMQTLHWGTLVVVACLYATAWMIEDASSAAGRDWLIGLHRSLGMTVLLLAAVRMVLHRSIRIPILPDEIPWWQRVAARLNVVALYGMLVVQPMLGLLASTLAGGRVVLFTVVLPRVLRTDPATAHLLLRLHGGCALAFLASVAVHALAALYHYYVRNDRVPATMPQGGPQGARTMSRTKGGAR
jgi:cytochrome b561